MRPSPQKFPITVQPIPRSFFLPKSSSKLVCITVERNIGILPPLKGSQESLVFLNYFLQYVVLNSKIIYELNSKSFSIIGSKNFHCQLSDHNHEGRNASQFSFSVAHYFSFGFCNVIFGFTFILIFTFTFISYPLPCSFGKRENLSFLRTMFSGPVFHDVKSCLI